MHVVVLLMALMPFSGALLPASRTRRSTTADVAYRRSGGRGGRSGRVCPLCSTSPNEGGLFFRRRSGERDVGTEILVKLAELEGKLDQRSTKFLGKLDRQLGKLDRQ